MFQSITSSIRVVILATLLGAGLTANANAQDKNSGFLKDYSQLKTEKDPLGVERRIWVSPKFTQENYQKALMKPISFYPAPKSSKQVSMGALNDIRTYSDSELRKAFAAVIPLVEAPGPGVLQLRIALTAVAVDDFSIKPYQLVPVALVFTGAKEATGKSKRDVKLFVEAEITDSVTGEPLARFVREAQGIEIASGAKLTLKDAKPQIDKWAKAVEQFLSARLTPAGK